MQLKYKRRDELEAEIKTLEKDYSEQEYKFSCILDSVTGGCISKPHTDKAVIDEAIHRQVSKEWEYAIKDYKESNPPPTIENTICNWKREEDNIYKTECGNLFQLTNDDTPHGNDFKFCPYCGGELKYAILFPDEINKPME